MPARDVALAVLIAIAWGFNFVVIKVGLETFPPLLFSALRFTLAALPLVFFLPRPATGWPIILGIGFMLGVVKFSLLFIGMDVGLSAGMASLLLQSQAFFTLILAALLLGERPGRAGILGMVVAFAGIGLVGATVDGASTLTGIALTLAAGLAWGVSNIILRKAGRVAMLNLIVWASLVPPLPLLALSMVFEGRGAAAEAFAAVGWPGVGAVFYVAFVATIFGFGGWGLLISRHGASRVAPFSLLVPIFGMGSSAVFLGEEFGALRLIGAALVLVGLALTVVGSRRAPVPAAGG